MPASVIIKLPTGGAGTPGTIGPKTPDEIPIPIAILFISYQCAIKLEAVVPVAYTRVTYTGKKVPGITIG